MPRHPECPRPLGAHDHKSNLLRLDELRNVGVSAGLKRELGNLAASVRMWKDHVLSSTPICVLVIRIS